jgi:hypothetical protein
VEASLGGGKGHGGGGWSGNAGGVSVGGLVGKVAGGLITVAGAAAAAAGGGGPGAAMGKQSEAGSVAAGDGIPKPANVNVESKAATLARHRAELHRAVALLHRTVGVLCADASHALGVSAPVGWGPFATLALLTATLSRCAPRASTLKHSQPQKHPELQQRTGQRNQRQPTSGGRRYRTWGAWDMRDSVAPAISRATSGVGQSLMLSVFGPGASGRGGTGGTSLVGGGDESVSLADGCQRGTAQPIVSEGRSGGRGPTTIIEGGDYDDLSHEHHSDDECYDDVDDDDYSVVLGGSGGGYRSAFRQARYMGAQTVADLGAEGWDLVDLTPAWGPRLALPEEEEAEEEDRGGYTQGYTSTTGKQPEQGEGEGTQLRHEGDAKSRATHRHHPHDQQWQQQEEQGSTQGDAHGGTHGGTQGGTHWGTQQEQRRDWRRDPNSPAARVQPLNPLNPES